MNTSKCTKCNITKALEDFPKEKGYYRRKCKSCRNEDKRNRYKHRREEILKQQQKSYEKNKTRILDNYRKKYWEDPEKFRKRSKNWRKNNFDTYKTKQLKQNLGVEYELYKKLLTKQNNVCSICKEGNGEYSLCVDHCHSTGEIRGLLCFQCNLGIGNFKDNPDLLEKAITYLENSKCPH